METHSSEEEDENDSNEEALFLSIEEKSDEISNNLGVKNNEKPMNVKTTLHAKVEPDAWIIDSGCSSHTIGDKGKFIDMKNYDG